MDDASSSLAGSTSFAGLAHLVEHLSYKQGARGSKPRLRTSFAGIAQLAERDLGKVEAIGSIPISGPSFVPVVQR